MKNFPFSFPTLFSMRSWGRIRDKGSRKCWGSNWPIRPRQGGMIFWWGTTPNNFWCRAGGTEIRGFHFKMIFWFWTVAHFHEGREWRSWTVTETAEPKAHFYARVFQLPMMTTDPASPFSSPVFGVWSRKQEWMQRCYKKRCEEYYEEQLLWKTQEKCFHLPVAKMQTSWELHHCAFLFCICEGIGMAASNFVNI